jgi:ABC-2 type transport system permease protein
MSALGNIIKKELRELLTPGTILPIIILTIIFSSLGSTIGNIEEEIQQKPEIGLINADNGSYALIASSVFQNYSTILYNSSDIEDTQAGLAVLREKEGSALLIIPENFSSNIQNQIPGRIEIYWIMRGAGILDSISSAAVEGLISNAQYQISRDLIEEANTSSNATIVLFPTTRLQSTNLKGKDLPGISPGDIAQVMSTQSSTTPVIMMMIIIIAGGMVISSMALEKENKTLETLLTLPVRRVSIVTGKIVGSALVGLLLAFIYMFGLGYYMQSFSFQSPTGSAVLDFSLSTFDIALVGISLFLALIAGLSLCMLLGTMAKNYKSAQALTAPITMMALFPMLLTLFTDFDTLPLGLKALVFGIPFSHPMMAPRALFFDNYTLVIGGIAYSAVFSAISIGLVIWVFTTDRLIAGGNWGLRVKRMFRRK